MNNIKVVENFMKRGFDAQRAVDRLTGKLRELFVGGSHDGARIEIRVPNEFIRLPVKQQDDQLLAADSKLRTAQVPSEIYRRHQLCDQYGGRHCVYAITEPDINVVATLIAGYRKPHERT
jgi:hypothetical protein